ncbi:xanthine dehydrogenase family protein molybdopterin-binding subunit [Haladaptatus sp. CMAA 1911]|uniref:xanthine dehydrogenase family protein molybdopterin-binding subunit n=1 Tax=unclassified Haladaptatus TaxID=2622732 RepID=UPI003754CA56
MSETPDGPLVGRDIERREDPALVTGRATYTDDVQAADGTHLCFVRSRYGHATVEGINTEAAKSMEGVLGVYTWEDIEASDSPGVIPVRAGTLDHEIPGHPVLARGRVRYHGQPVAAVVAEDRYVARDAANAVDVSYDRLDAVTDPIEATGEDAPTIFEGVPGNVVTVTEMGDSDAAEEAFEDADRTVEVELENNRLIANAMEPRAALAEYDETDDSLTVTMTSQSPHGHRGKLSTTLGIPENRLRVVAPDVGGGFGHKGHHHPGEAMAAWCARELGRPVKWTATRSENNLAGAHGRDHRTTAELAFDDDGTIRGLRAETHAGIGGYGLGVSPALPGWYGRLLASQYRIPAIHCRTHSVLTNTAPVHSYRGAGRPEAVYVTERLVDRAARELDIDPAEFRRGNQLSPDEFPHETAVGANYDSGEYETALVEALDAVDYDALRERQADEREREQERERENGDGPYLGIGVANYVESTGGGFESGVVRVHPDGGVTVYAGTHSHGQGHGTTYAQIVADELGVPYDDIDVVEGDTERIPAGTGTFGSRSTITGGNAVAESAGEVAEKARRIAANRLEAAPEDVEHEGGEFRVIGAPERSISFETVADAAYGRGLPEGESAGLESTTFYEQDGTAYAFGTHVAVVAVDPDSGEIDVERYVAVDDCGEQVNPRIVEGQVHGGVAQGLGQALYEEAVYDDAGTLVTGSLQDYAVPKITQLPSMETRSTVTPSPTNPLGVKGIGEAGTIAAPPAIVNAVLDALEPFGVEEIDMPLTPERVWRTVQNAK